MDFEHNFYENKAIFRRHTNVWQGKLTQLPRKFAKIHTVIPMITTSYCSA